MANRARQSVLTPPSLTFCSPDASGPVGLPISLAPLSSPPCSAPRLLCSALLCYTLCSLLSAVICSLLCSLLSALCSLLSALCSLLSALCSLLSALCSLLSAVLCSLLALLYALCSALLCSLLCSSLLRLFTLDLACVKAHLLKVAPAGWHLAGSPGRPDLLTTVRSPFTGVSVTVPGRVRHCHD